MKHLKLTYKEFIAESTNVKLSYGTKGHLKESDLVNPVELFKDAYAKMDKIMQSGSHCNIQAEFGGDIAFETWKNYVKNMFGGNVNPTGARMTGFHANDKDRKYPKAARGFFGWLEDIRTGKLNNMFTGKKFPILIYRDGDNCIFGHWVNLTDMPNIDKIKKAMPMIRHFPGMFMGCYISSTSPLGLMKLVKGICAYDNIVFQVTLDMAAMLERLQMYTDGEVYIAKYNGHDVEKKIFASSEKSLRAMQIYEKLLQHGFTVDNFDLNDPNKPISVKFTK